MINEKNAARWAALQEIKSDLLSWLITDTDEQDFAISVIKKIEKYQKYLLKENK